jgi:hypothetical protein
MQPRRIKSCDAKLNEMIDAFVQHYQETPLTRSRDEVLSSLSLSSSRSSPQSMELLLRRLSATSTRPSASMMREANTSEDSLAADCDLVDSSAAHLDLEWLCDDVSKPYRKTFRLTPCTVSGQDLEWLNDGISSQEPMSINSGAEKQDHRPRRPRWFAKSWQNLLEHSRTDCTIPPAREADVSDFFRWRLWRAK